MSRDRAESEGHRTSESTADRSRGDREETGSSESAGVAALHRRFGNSALQRLHQAGDLQASLAVSAPDDEHEREAERVADRLVGGPSRSPAPRRTTPGIQRDPDGSDDGGGSGAERAGDAERSVRSAVSGGGKPLDAGTRSAFEPRFGRDFSDVRVHTGSQADEAARSIDAEAFTMGSDVAFRKGNYEPSTSSGKRLLAHELTHVVQQGGADAEPSRVDREADGDGVGVRDLPLPTTGSAVPTIHRLPSGVRFKSGGGSAGGTTAEEEETDQGSDGSGGTSSTGSGDSGGGAAWGDAGSTGSSNTYFTDTGDGGGSSGGAGGSSGDSSGTTTESGGTTTDSDGGSGGSDGGGAGGSSYTYFKDTGGGSSGSGGGETTTGDAGGSGDSSGGATRGSSKTYFEDTGGSSGSGGGSVITAGEYFRPADGDAASGATTSGRGGRGTTNIGGANFKSTGEGGDGQTRSEEGRDSGRSTVSAVVPFLTAGSDQTADEGSSDSSKGVGSRVGGIGATTGSVFGTTQGPKDQIIEPGSSSEDKTRSDSDSRSNEDSGSDRRRRNRRGTGRDRRRRARNRRKRGLDVGASNSSTSGADSGRAESDSGKREPETGIVLKLDSDNPGAAINYDVVLGERVFFEQEKDFPVIWGIIGFVGAEASAEATVGAHGSLQYQSVGGDNDGDMYPGEASGTVGLHFTAGANLTGTVGAGAGIPKGANIGVQGEVTGGAELGVETNMRAILSLDGEGNLESLELIPGALKVGVSAYTQLSVGPYIEVLDQKWQHMFDFAHYNLLTGSIGLRIGALSYNFKSGRVSFDTFEPIPPNHDLNWELPPPIKVGDPFSALLSWINNKEDDAAREMIETMKHRGLLAEMDAQRKSKLMEKATDTINLGASQKRILDVIKSADNVNDARYLVFDFYVRENGEIPDNGEAIHTWIHGFFQLGQWATLVEELGGDQWRDFAPWGFRNPYKEPKTDNSIYDEYIDYFRENGAMTGGDNAWL